MGFTDEDWSNCKACGSTEHLTEACTEVKEEEIELCVLIMAADLLKMASEKFSLRGCTDYALPDTPAARVIVRRSGVELSDGGMPFNAHDGQVYTDDWVMMSYAAHYIKERLEAKYNDSERK
jgi:hypothetical protein